MGSTVHRASVAVCAFCALTACSRGLPAPELTAVEPSRVMAGERSPITIVGQHLYAPARARLDSPAAPTVDARFQVSLGERALDAAEVTQLDAQHLGAVAPADLPIGDYDVTVVTPRGQRLTLAAALHVLAEVPDLAAPTDGAPTPSDLGPDPTAPDLGGGPDLAGCESCAGGGNCNGSCCTYSCDTSSNCALPACSGSCSCFVACNSTQSCSLGCGGNSRCDGTVTDATTTTVNCSGSATCDFRCAGQSACKLSCTGSARCTLRCTAPATCELANCAPTTCPDGTLVCGGAACP